MKDYKLTEDGVQRRSDEAFVPNEPLNRDWVQYQKWFVAGNTPDPME